MAKYTADEMREIADELGLVNDEYHRKASAMLIQSADLMEREDERKKRYEYVVEFRYCGKWKVYKNGLTLADARKIASEPWCSPHRIVRREVGKREVVSWG